MMCPQIREKLSLLLKYRWTRFSRFQPMAKLRHNVSDHVTGVTSVSVSVSVSCVSCVLCVLCLCVLCLCLRVLQQPWYLAEQKPHFHMLRHEKIGLSRPVSRSKFLSIPTHLSKSSHLRYIVPKGITCLCRWCQSVF